VKTACTLIISTYNWPKALHLCLQSVLAQTMLPSEIIIADDGSTAETKAIIDLYKNETKIPVNHVWQEDNGYRLAAIRNKAFAAASNPYIIQIDGDLILEKHFMQDHLALAKKGYFVSATRAMINEVHTTFLFNNADIKFLDKWQLDKKFNALRFPFLAKMASAIKNKTRSHTYVLGANMAFWKTDLIAVNGYNEDFTGWGKEDTELAARLTHHGTLGMIIRNMCIAYHLHHKEASRSGYNKNEELYHHTIKSRMVRCGHGMVR
jgi:glycosyltransferase involved in cell wall biosynthesis